MAKILYAEDKPELAKECIALLEKKGYTVFYASDGEQALELYRENEPDVALLDVMMPKMTGWDVAKAIRKDDPMIPILFISDLDDTINVVTGLKIGETDYLRKSNIADEELIVRIEIALNRVMFRERSDKTIEVSDDVYLDPVVREFVVGKEVLSLSPIEVKVMKLLCMNKNCILKKEVVVQAGWGNTYKESYRYLDKLLVGLRKMLPKDGSISIATAWGKGLGLMVKEKRKRKKI